jgi:ABC-type branched-subunit amino acid transport system substrate-binding protein
MHWLKRVFPGIFYLGVLLFSFSARAEPGISPTAIRFGQSLPLSGPLAQLGTEYHDGALAYFKWVNSKGGVNGRQIELVTLDDGYVVDKTVANAKQLLDQEGVFAFFGMFGTANYAAVMPIINERNVLSFAPYTGADDLRKIPSPNTFWLRASYGDETEKIIEQLTTLGIKRIAVFYQNDAFGENGLAGVERALKARKLDVLVSASYDKAKNDVGPAVAKIGAADPQAVVMISTYKPTAAFVKQMRLSGKAPQAFAISVVGYKALQAELGNDAAGIAISQVVPYPWSRSVPLVREFESLPKELLPASGITYTSFEGFIAAKVMVEALRKAGPQVTHDKLASALEGMHSYDLGGFNIGYGPDERMGSHFAEVTIVGNSGRLMR